MADMSDLIWKATAGTPGDMLRAFGMAQEAVHKNREFEVKQKLAGYQLAKEEAEAPYYESNAKNESEKLRLANESTVQGMQVQLDQNRRAETAAAEGTEMHKRKLADAEAEAEIKARQEKELMIKRSLDDIANDPDEADDPLQLRVQATKNPEIWAYLGIPEGDFDALNARMKRMRQDVAAAQARQAAEDHKNSIERQKANDALEERGMKVRERGASTAERGLDITQAHYERMDANASDRNEIARLKAAQGVREALMGQGGMKQSDVNTLFKIWDENEFGNIPEDMSFQDFVATMSDPKSEFSRQLMKRDPDLWDTIKAAIAKMAGLGPEYGGNKPPIDDSAIDPGEELFGGVDLNAFPEKEKP